MSAYQVDLEKYKQELKLWKDSGGESERPIEPIKPTWVRCWTDDTTIEALASLLQQNPQGLLLSSDELSAWFASFDRYAKSGSKSGGDAAKWLHIHGGRALMIDRKTGVPPTIYVPRATVSVAGGIQPGVLCRTLSREHQESGMAARFLYAMPPIRQKRWTETEVDEQVETDLMSVFDALFDLKPGKDDEGEPIPILVKLSTKAKHECWIPYVNELGKEQITLDDDLSATWSKLEGYAARFALIHHLIRVAAGDISVDDPNVIDEVSMSAGIGLSRWFGQEAKRVFAMLSESEEEKNNRELGELIERIGGSVTANELRRHTRKYPSPDDAEKAMENLVKSGGASWVDRPPGPDGGRPTRVCVLLPVVKTPPEQGQNDGLGNSNNDGASEWGEI